MTPERIDAHAHVWRRERTPQPWIDPVTMTAIDRDFGIADLLRAWDDAGIWRGVLVQTNDDAAETADLCATAAIEPRIAGVVGWIDLHRVRDGLPPEAAGLVGVRHLVHQEADADWLAGAAAGLDALGRANVPFDLVVRADQLPLAAATARAHPATGFVLDHLGKPDLRVDLGTWESRLRAIAALPNTVAKLSGLISEAAPSDDTAAAAAIAVALDAFGPDRLMLGTDWPLVELGGGARAWCNAVDRALAPLTALDRAAVFGGTATRWYGLATGA